MLQGLSMDYQLNVGAIVRRAEALFGHKEIVTRNADKSFHRYTYADFVPRSRRLAAALRKLGLEDGDRVGTFAWNHYRHLEAYLGLPAGGLVIHTLNLRLHPDDLTYIARHGGDRALIVDKILWPLAEKFVERVGFEHVVVISDDGEAPDGTIEYEQLLASVDDDEVGDRDVDEWAAAAMCYTSGTTGQPKGVVYSHRAIAIHTLAATMAGSLGVTEADVVLPVVPMFHANAWGFPFQCTLTGATQVFPGPHLDPESLLETFQQERVTLTAGVPTIWMGILQMLDADPGKYDLSSLKGMVVGGSAAPRAMIEGYQERHGLKVIHAWGMTEMAPLGSISELSSDQLQLPQEEQYAYRAKQGFPAAFVEIRAMGEDGVVPWDGQTMGELEVRGPWIASGYYNDDSQAHRWSADGWFATGDIVTIEPNGYIEIQDRSKDLVKSGGEWISTVALENALMGHPAIAEAAVIAVPDEKWAERPMAVCVCREGQSVTPEELRAFLEPQFAKWWLPDHYEFVAEIPKTAVGKFRKTALREQFAQQPAEAPART
jgi:fatty-acyl-CoA synthase